MSRNTSEPTKFSFIEFIKKTWVPLGGFIGGVVSIYEFIDYWCSDRLIINWILIFSGLLFWFVGLAWIGYSSEKKPTGLVDSHGSPLITNKKQFDKVFRLAQFLLVLRAVIAAFSVFAYKARIERIHQIRLSKIVVLIDHFRGKSINASIGAIASDGVF